MIKQRVLVVTIHINRPGSEYKLTLKSAGTFHLTESTESMDLNGTWSTLDTGFKKLTITQTNKTSPAVNESAFLLDIPGVISLLKPIGAKTQIINMVQGGSCPSADFTSNWIRADKGLNIANQEVVGTASYTHSSTSMFITDHKLVTGADATANDNNNTFTCSNGSATIKNGGNTMAGLYLTTNGTAIVRTGGDDNTYGNTDDGFIVALPAQTIGTKAALDGNLVCQPYPHFKLNKLSQHLPSIS